MMKKLLLVAALILVVGFCFAQDADDDTPAKDKPELFDLEVTAGVPIHWTNGLATHGFFGTDDEDKTVTANTAIGVALLFNFGRKIGFTLDTDFFFGSDVMGHPTPESFSSTLFGINALLGPVIYLYNGSFLRIPLAMGLHVYYWSSDHWASDGVGAGMNDAWAKMRDLQMGPGLYIGIQFHFNNNIYIFSRTTVAVDLFRWHQIWYNDGAGNVSKDTDTEFTVAWHVKPALGLGIKF